jgi:hypothetical protein
MVSRFTASTNLRCNSNLRYWPLRAELMIGCGANGLLRRTRCRHFLSGRRHRMTQDAEKGAGHALLLIPHSLGSEPSVVYMTGWSLRVSSG